MVQIGAYRWISYLELPPRVVVELETGFTFVVSNLTGRHAWSVDEGSDTVVGVDKPGLFLCDEPWEM